MSGLWGGYAGFSGGGGLFGGSGSSPSPALPAWLNGGTILADGWSLDAVSTPPSTVLEEPIAVTRAGYDSTGNITTYSDTLTYVTRRVRQPGSTSLDALRCGLSFDIYAGDVVPGMTNNSAAVCPPVVANWEMLDRDVVGNTLPDIEVGAIHQFGVPVLVRFTATDGTNTVTFDATAPVAVKSATDQLHRTVFRWVAANITSLNNGIITVNARCFPLYGTSASIRDSATTGFSWWEFAPRYFIKDTTRAGAIPRCYVDAAGSDSTGVWSTNDATAAATPFLTIAGALGTRRSQIVAGAYLPAGAPDGCEIRLRAGTFTMAGPAANITEHRGGAVIITRDPAVARADAVAASGASSVRWRLAGGVPAPLPGGAVRLRDVTWRRAGAGQHSGETGAQVSVQKQNVSFDNNAVTGSYLTTNAFSFIDGMACVGMAGSALLPGATTAIGLARGISGDMNARNIAAVATTGCNLQNVSQLVAPSIMTTERNVTLQAIYARSKSATGETFFVGITKNLEGYGRWNVVCESIGTTGYPAHRVSGDGNTGNTTGVFIFHETHAGYNDIGRHNDRYVDTDATGARTHTRQALLGCIMVQYNTKHDLFAPINAARIGGWPVAFGCGTDHNYVQFLDAGGGSFAPDYAGRGSTVGTSNVTGLNPLFVDPEATTAGPTAGAGNGDYRLQSGSPCKNIDFGRVYVPFDIEGTARGTTTSIGAFV